jgi:Methyltransferase domain
MTPSCPVCRSENLASLGSVSSEEAAQHFVLREGNPSRHDELRAHIERLWQRSDCEFRQCNDCGFGFAWPYVAGDGRFYNLAYPTIGFPRDKWEYHRTVEALRPLAEPGGEKMALEIGSGFGYFLDMVCPRYVERNRVMAVEYHEECQRSLAKKGYRTMSVDIRSEEFLALKSQFSFIFMFQVLEHMDRLDAVMERLRFLAARGCHLFIAVPNARRVAFNEQHGGLLDMPPNHIGRWTEPAFRALAARFGFEVVSTDLEPPHPLSFAKEDLVFSYLRRAQESGSLPNRVRSLPRSRWRSLLEALAVASSAPSRLSAWQAAWKESPQLGDALWAHLCVS